MQNKTRNCGNNTTNSSNSYHAANVDAINRDPLAKSEHNTSRTKEEEEAEVEVEAHKVNARKHQQ